MKRIITALFAFSIIIMTLISCTNKSNPSAPGIATATATATSTSTAVSTATATQTIVTACFKVAGFDADDDNSNWSASYVLAVSFTATGNETINTLKVKLDASFNFAAGLYFGNASNPVTLLTQSPVTAGGAGWNTVTVPGHTLASGNIYWIAAIADGIALRSCDTCSEMYVYASYNFSNVTASGMPGAAALTWNDYYGQPQIAAIQCP